MKNALLALSFLFFSLVISAQTELPKTAIEISPLLIGEKIPNLSLKSADNVDVKLSDLFANKKTILVFYRGGWCPYCNFHLAALGESEKELLELGYQIIAVSPDSPAKLKITDEKNKLNYVLLSDSNGALSRAVGIAFQAPATYKSTVTEGSDGANTALFLPVAAVFITDETGVIQFEHITPDFKHRISNDLLIAAAKSLK
jgi:peroxiredoxin